MGRGKNNTVGMGCEVCGKNGECFEVYLGNERHIFDSFECATSVMLPKCTYCRCQILGDGVQVSNEVFCSFECANERFGREFERLVIIQEQSHL